MDRTINSASDAAVNPHRQAEEIAPTLKGDRSLWGIYLLLCLVSLVELYSASSQEVSAHSNLSVYGPLVRHGLQLLLGFGIILLIQARSYTSFILWSPILAVVSAVLMVVVLLHGKDINGAQRGLDLGFVSLYPSELIKLSAAMVIALIMAWTHSNNKNEKRKNLGVWLSAGVAVGYGALLCTQGLTNTILLMGISFAMMIIGGVGFVQLMKVLGVYICAAVVLLSVTILFQGSVSASSGGEEGVATEQVIGDDGKPVAKAVQSTGLFGRLQTWINRLSRHSGDGRPKYEQPVNDENRQEMYGYMAQAHGRVWGVLPGNSRETARLPLAFSDYIYSIIVEEWGLVGGLFVLVLYLWLLARASSIASRCNQRFAALLVIGMAVMIVLQALFHMAIVTGVFPVSGQPLPLISKGGTSILVTSIAFGVMLSVSRFGLKTGRKQDEKIESESLPESLRSVNPNQLV